MAGRRRALVAAATVALAFVLVAASAVALRRGLRTEPPRRVWIGHRVEPGGAERVLDGIFDAPAGREISGVVADWNDRSLLLWVGAFPRSRFAAAVRGALGLMPRGWDYAASADVVTLGDTTWFPYDRDDGGD